MPQSFGPSIVPSGQEQTVSNQTVSDQTVYLVVNNFGSLGVSYVETDIDKADLETTIAAPLTGQYNDPLRVVAFNTAEGWAKDVSADIAREIMRRVDELPSSLAAFVERGLNVMTTKITFGDMRSTG